MSETNEQDRGCIENALKPRHQRFVQEYLVSLDPAAAYKRAGYRSKNDATASANGRRLLRNALISAEIARQQADLAQKCSISAQHVINELARLAFSDIGQVLDFSGPTLKLRPPETINEDARRALASVKVRRYTEGSGDEAREVEVSEFKLADKLTALGKLGRHLGMFKPESAAPATANVENRVKVDSRKLFADIEEYLPVFEKIAQERILAREETSKGPAAGPENDTI